MPASSHACCAEDGRLLPRRYWPRLGVVASWKGPGVNTFIDKCREWYGDIPFRDVGYGSSEFRTGLILSDDGSPNLPVPDTYFYEFIPEDDRDAYRRGDKRPLLLHELELGRRYLIVQTGPHGLYRYDIEDIVEVNGFHGPTPTIAFVQKARTVTSITGEKLYESQVVEAMDRVGARLPDLKPSFFMCLADVEEANYKLCVEFDEPRSPEQLEELATRFEGALGEVNVEYPYKRASLRLRAPEVHQLAPGASVRFIQHVGRNAVMDNQAKIPRLSADVDRYLPALGVRRGDTRRIVRAEPFRLRRSEPRVHGYAYRSADPAAALVLVHGLQSHAGWFDEAADRPAGARLLGLRAGPPRLGLLSRRARGHRRPRRLARRDQRRHPARRHRVPRRPGAPGRTLLRRQPRARLRAGAPAAGGLRRAADPGPACASRLHARREGTHRRCVSAGAARAVPGAPARRALHARPGRARLDPRRPRGRPHADGALRDPDREAGRAHAPHAATARAAVARDRGRAATGSPTTRATARPSPRRWAAAGASPAFDAEHFLLAEPCRDDVLDLLVRWTATVSTPTHQGDLTW